jgi:dipeptidyl aminopeptidase/acylaminoacyl peptidase
MSRWLGDPDTEADDLLARSPISFAEGIEAPLLVLQGLNDRLVPPSESEQMVERLRALGREVEYVTFPDEGHNVGKRRNELTAHRLAAEWLERHLVGSSRPRPVEREAVVA